MKNILIILALIFSLPFILRADPPWSGYKLVHFDDFNDDATNIGDEISAGYPLDNGNVTGTCSWPIKANVDISNGTLNARVKKELTPHPTNSNAGNRVFSAGNWHSYITFRYGYFEAKIKVTELDHVWGAFWLLKGGGIGAYQEIDIMEFMTANPVRGGNLSCSQHWWPTQTPSKDCSKYWWKGPHTSCTRHWSTDYGDVNGDLDLSVYHVYGCEWTPTNIKFYIDGNIWCTMDNYDLHDPMHVKIDMGRQKKDDDCGASTTTSTMMVDYLKVWQIPGSTPDGLYTKGEKECQGGLNSLLAIGNAQSSFSWDNMIHLAWYPQATYTVQYKSSPNIPVNEIGWPFGGGTPWNCRGEITKGFLYASNVPGTYEVSIHIAFPPGYGYAQDKTFTIIIGEIDFMIDHIVVPCFGLDFITGVRSNPTMDSYEISTDNGASWRPIDPYEDPSPGYSFITRGHLNGHIISQLHTYHYAQVANYCGQFLSTNSPKFDKVKLDKIIEKREQEKDNSIVAQVPVTPQVKLETYKTLIYNVSGQLLKTCETSQNQVRDFLTEYQSGMYFVHQFDKTGKRIATFKVSWVK
jgi:beta-glucanase (GH16 family)